jgi:hypothetical protein
MSERDDLLKAHLSIQGPHSYSYEAAARKTSFSDRFKFRAWNGEKMVIVNLLSLDDERVADYYNFYDAYAGEWIDINDKHPLMQFTGTYDKNGAEVYEGDLVHCFGWAKGVYHTVVFNTPRFCIELNGSLDLLPFGVNIEVVGNIFNNPK